MGKEEKEVKEGRRKLLEVEKNESSSSFRHTPRPLASIPMSAFLSTFITTCVFVCVYVSACVCAYERERMLLYVCLNRC